MWKEKLEEIIELAEENSDLISYKISEEFIKKYDNYVVFGASAGGAKTKEFLDKLGKNVVYFVDNDINKKGKEFLGKIVKHPSEILFFDNKVIIASMWWYDIKKQLEEHYGLLGNIEFFLAPFVFIENGDMELKNTQKKFFDLLKLNFYNYLQIFDLLEDDASRVLYFRVLKGRVFYGKNLIWPPMPKVEYNQYFHPKVKPEDDDIIVDAGAYIGDTIEEIIKQNINYKKIYAFEPDNQNYSKLIENTKKYDNIFCNKFGLWKQSDKLHFIADGTGESTITDNFNEANQTIDVISLDEFFKDKEKPTLIKMDIEGAELEALYGTKEIITKYKPKLQICIYHKPEHLWQIPMLLKDWVKEYKLYIGHHSFDFTDTVLYAKV
ncbi:MAG: FkbM family methyltransferase [Desulfurella sp.]|uniref:FkbM family methyltransferase n=1 Tax=Desulfurella sp. TaxID=1962857 RepID=UPI003D0B6B73